MGVGRGARPGGVGWGTIIKNNVDLWLTQALPSGVGMRHVSATVLPQKGR